MSNARWRMVKQAAPFKRGKTPTDRVAEYVKTWKDRCYCEDIPDEVPRKVEASGRAPSYRAIAIAILKNDLTFKSLGFGGGDWDRVKELAWMSGNKAFSCQLNFHERLSQDDA